MNSIPAWCLRCGAVFGSGIPLPAPGAQHHLYRFNNTTCPHCRGRAAVADLFIGTTIDDDNSQIVIDGLPKAAMVAFYNLLKQRYAGAVSPADFEEKAARINRKLGPVAKTINRSSAGAVLVLLALAALRACSVNTEIKINLDVAEVVKVLLDKKPAEILASEPDIPN